MLKVTGAVLALTLSFYATWDAEVLIQFIQISLHLDLITNQIFLMQIMKPRYFGGNQNAGIQNGFPIEV